MPIFVIVLVIMFLSAALRVVREYERIVVFRLGRCIGEKGPGLVIVIPVIDTVKKVDLRVVAMDVPAQNIITKDNVPVQVDAVVYFKVVDSVASVVNVEKSFTATSQIAQTTLRSVLGESELDELLSNREKINQKLREIIDEHTDPWGIKVTMVEVKDVKLPQSMQRAMARQAEAERERRAKIIAAEGEFQASQRLTEAAGVLAKNAAAIQLRYLQTLTEISSEHNSTIIFPIPIELVGNLAKIANKTDLPKDE
jgi:regulator of protease activity HflC (stomatin/prohibitin superfamily)